MEQFYFFAVNTILHFINCMPKIQRHFRRHRDRVRRRNETYKIDSGEAPSYVPTPPTQ